LFYEFADYFASCVCVWRSPVGMPSIEVSCYDYCLIICIYNVIKVIAWKWFIWCYVYWVYYYSLFGFYFGRYCFKVFINDVLRMLDRIVD